MQSGRPLRELARVVAVVLAAAGCEDGIRLNHDMAITKRLAGTSLAFMRTDPDLVEYPHLVWDRGPKEAETTVLDEGNGVSFLPKTVAWDRAFAVGSGERYDRFHREPASGAVRWYVIDLRGADGPRVAYEGDSRTAYDAERSKLGVPPSLVPRPMLHYWPNWEGSPRPGTKDDACAELDPETGVGSTTRALPVGDGYFVQDSLRTFLVLSKDPPGPATSPTPVRLTRKTADVFRIGWDDRFIVADVCFLVSDGCSEPTVDRTMPVATVVVDTKTGRGMWEINRRSAAKIRRRFGVPDSLLLRDVLLVWPDWPDIRRPWRKDPETLKFLGLE